MQARLDEIARELEKLLELEESLASLQARLDAQVAALSHSGELADLRRQKSVLLEKMEIQPANGAFRHWHRPFFVRPETFLKRKDSPKLSASRPICSRRLPMAAGRA